MDFITNAQLRDWLQALMAERTVIAPKRVNDRPVLDPPVAHDLTLYERVTDPADIVYDFTRSAISPKDFFLPASEAILTIERVRRAAGAADGGTDDAKTAPTWDVKLTEAHLDRDQIIFAMRPCDAHALTALDALLLADPADGFYAERRQRTTLVGLACTEMGPSCFCTSVGLAPDDAAGMDVMLYPAEGGYLVETLTDKGRVAATALASTPFTGERAQTEWPPAQYTVPPRAVWTQLFNDPYWSQLADRCLSCKVCAYVCPTCRCFDVRDYTTAQGPGYQQIERLRCWDSCMAEGYRRIAGGHNPRAAKAQRLRNRFYCKFDYYPADFGPLACVGCGRCIDECPVNVDITEVVATMAQKGQGVEVDGFVKTGNRAELR
jgi:sulfhydrogenase subunit beta (sulfur reductase)